MIVGGDPFPVSGRSPEPFAEALARLVALAPKPEELDTLDPAPPWTSPSDGTDLWPWPDDRDIDLNEVSGPAWIDESGWRPAPTPGSWGTTDHRTRGLVHGQPPLGG